MVTTNFQKIPPHLNSQ